MTSSADVSPSTTPCGTPLGGAPKYGTVIPNRIFVGGIAANTTEQELRQFFLAYGAVKDSKIISDRAGVSKGYGFITFENQEDADRIIKKEADNLVFRDRKLNIGPAIRKQQVLPRAFESPVSPGSIMYSNGIPYTYQNGMAIFASPEGAGYAVPQAQPQTALMVPQTPPMYAVQPQYATYQVPLSYASSYQTSPQWASPAAAAATTAQWRYMTQSPTQALTAAAGNPYMIAMQPELMYAQVPPSAYQPTELDASVLDATAGVEHVGRENVPEKYIAEQGSLLPADPCATELQRSRSSVQTVVPAPVTLQHNTSMTVVPSISTATRVSSCINAASPLNTAANKVPTRISPVNVAPYKRQIPQMSQRTYPSSTYLVRNGHKVQCVMVPPKTLATGQMKIVACAPEDAMSTPTGARL